MRRSQGLLVSVLAVALIAAAAATTADHPSQGRDRQVASARLAAPTTSPTDRRRLGTQAAGLGRPTFLPAGTLASVTRPVDASGDRTDPAVRPGVLFLGDSVMLGARPWLQPLPGRVDAVESRQVYQGISIVRHLARTGRLPGTLVVDLGTNGQFPSYVCGDLRRALGARGKLLLVTVRVPRPWTAPDNHAIAACARRFANVSLVPWRAYSGRHPAVFAADGYHLSARGGRAYARLIRASLGA